MNLKNRVKTYAFWVALSSAVVVLVQSIGKLFGFEIESSTIENVIMSICGVLIVLGIVTNSTDPKTGDAVDYDKSQDEISESFGDEPHDDTLDGDTTNSEKPTNHNCDVDTSLKHHDENNDAKK